MRQSVCLVINPSTVYNFAALFHCTPVDRASDSMMATTYSYSFPLVGTGALSSVALSIGAVVVCRLHYIRCTTLKQEFNGAKAYKDISTDEKTVVNSHSIDLPYNVAVNVKDFL